MSTTRPFLFLFGLVMLFGFANAQAPVAAFSGTPTIGPAPLTVSFTDASTGSPTGWAWYFGDEDFMAPWTQQTASAGWSGRFYFSSVAMPNGSIVLMGGMDSSGIFKNDVWRSTDNGATWTQVNASAGWSARCLQSSVAMPDGSIVLMGGQDGSQKNDVWRSTDNGATWTQVNASAGWTPRYAHSSVAMPDGSILLMGGDDGNFKNDVWRSTDYGATWTQMTAGAGWSAREQHSSVVMTDGSIVLMGGQTVSDHNDVWRSTDYGATWTQMTASAGWSARRCHSSVAMPDGSIVLTGGWESGTYTNDVWRSTDNGSTWTRVNMSAGWSARYAHNSVAMPDGSIVLMGGYASGGVTNDVWRFMPAGSSAQNPSHTYTTPGTYPVALQAYNAGGYDSTSKTGYITVTTLSAPVADFTGSPLSGTVPLAVSFSDLSSNTPTGWAWYFGDEDYTEAWTQQTESAGWSGRHAQSSVVMPDGSIVLMGGNNGTSMNDVWRSTDNGVTWTEMAANAEWPARHAHSSEVMPDGSIVLMGGVDSTSCRNDVWRSTDTGATWTQQTANAEWSGRWGHSSVVMPDGSIVLMGGYDCGDWKNDVWRSTDNGATWTQVTASAEWTGRAHHRSVVMPDSSIVLTGGFTDSSGLGKNDVWRSTDYGATWTQLPDAEWTARYLHSSVVMPDGSIVLTGGIGDGIFKNDVWRSTDTGATWTQLPDAGWTTRYAHSSVVMPEGSIVLMGGYDGSSFKNDVWRFMPVGSSAQNPSHTYTTPGTYSVALQAYNAGGYDSTRKTGYITVSEAAPPVAGFSGTPTTGINPLTVVFTDESSGVITSYLWDFGDTATSPEQNPSHTYTNAGTYTVTLTVTGPDGSDTKTQTDYITVMELSPPVANAGPDQTVIVNKPVIFDGSGSTDSDGTIVSYAWDFGDTHTGSGVTTTHVYTAAGTYTVTLTVTDNGGLTGSDTAVITVKKPGSLEVKSSPSHANIYINGVNTGKFAKWTFDDMAPGDYDVYVTLDGYTTPETEHVTVVSEQTAGLHFKLKKIK